MCGRSDACPVACVLCKCVLIRSSTPWSQAFSDVTTLDYRVRCHQASPWEHRNDVAMSLVLVYSLLSSIETTSQQSLVALQSPVAGECVFSKFKSAQVCGKFAVVLIVS